MNDEGVYRTAPATPVCLICTDGDTADYTEVETTRHRDRLIVIVPEFVGKVLCRIKQVPFYLPGGN